MPKPWPARRSRTRAPRTLAAVSPRWPPRSCRRRWARPEPSPSRGCSRGEAAGRARPRPRGGSTRPSGPFPRARRRRGSDRLRARGSLHRAGSRRRGGGRAGAHRFSSSRRAGELQGPGPDRRECSRSPCPTRDPTRSRSRRRTERASRRSGGGSPPRTPRRPAPEAPAGCSRSAREDATGGGGSGRRGVSRAGCRSAARRAGGERSRNRDIMPPNARPLPMELKSAGFPKALKRRGCP